MSEVKRYAFKLTAISSICGACIELVEYTGEGMPYVLASDYDQLSEQKADWVGRAVSLGDQIDQLNAENERMSNKMTLVVDESNQHRKERDTLRKQLDEARKLLEMSRTYLMRVGDKESIDAWLEATKK